jgi:hypothetical protein
MIVPLLIVSFLTAFAAASLVVVIFSKPIDSILKRITPPEISYAWARYLRFAIYVVGIAGGVDVWSFDKYLVSQEPSRGFIALTADRWVLEIYNTIIGTLQSAAMMLLVFFVFALIAVVIVRLVESRAAKGEAK